MTNWVDRLKTRQRELRKTKGLTQEVIAERLGLSQGAVGHWFTGRREPDSLEMFCKLADLLEMHPAELMFGTELEPRSQNKSLLDSFDLELLDKCATDIEQFLEELQLTKVDPARKTRFILQMYERRLNNPQYDSEAAKKEIKQMAFLIRAS